MGRQRTSSGSELRGLCDTLRFCVSVFARFALFCGQPSVLRPQLSVLNVHFRLKRAQACALRLRLGFNPFEGGWSPDSGEFRLEKNLLKALNEA